MATNGLIGMDSIQSKAVSAQGQGVFLVRTVDRCTSFTMRVPTFEAMAHHFDWLVELNNPPLLMVSLQQWLMTGRTFLHWRIPLHLRAVTSVPSCSHEVGCFLTS
jgi:hypothetical protein